MSKQILFFCFFVLLNLFKLPQEIKAYWDDDFFNNDVTLTKPRNVEDAYIDVGERRRRRAKREANQSTTIPEGCKPKPLNLNKRITQSAPLSPEELEKAEKKA